VSEVDVLAVDHVEFFAGDARQAAFVLCSAFGFRVLGHGGPDTGAPGRRSLLTGQGGSRVLLTSGLASHHPAAEYVARHGDGVAVIAFRVEDAAAAYAESVAAGATPLQQPRVHERGGERVVTAVVSGFGDVAHRFVERSGPGAEFLPGLVEMADPPAADTPQLLTAIDHAAFCVPAGQLEPTVRHYRKTFGFEPIFEEYVEVGDQGMFSQVVQSQSGAVTFTLIEPDTSRRRGQIDDFLAWHGGAGVQHVALSTDDIAGAVDAFSARGAGFAPTPDAYYEELGARLGPIGIPVERLRSRGILADRDHWGLMYQIFARSMHVRNTFFWELIERHGARTFGTSNIPALYAAKERELSAVRNTAPTAAAPTNPALINPAPANPAPTNTVRRPA
jgi:4-hydroxymandelate synthase